MVLLLPHFGNQVDVQIAERAIRRNRIRSSLSPCRPNNYTSGSTSRSRSKSPLRCHGNKISLFSALDLCFLRPSEKSCAVICDQDDSQITVLGWMKQHKKLVCVRLYFVKPGLDIKSIIKKVLNDAERRSRRSNHTDILGLCSFRSRYLKENGFCMLGLVLEPEQTFQCHSHDFVEVCDGKPHAVLGEDQEEIDETREEEVEPLDSEPSPSLLSFGNQVDINAVKANIKNSKPSRPVNLPVLGSATLSFRDPRARINEPFVEPKTVVDSLHIRVIKCYHKKLKKMVQVSYLKKAAVPDAKLAVQVILNTARGQLKDGKGSAVIGFCAFNTSSSDDDAYHTIGLVTH